jgi:hypothetical protein
LVVSTFSFGLAIKEKLEIRWQYIASMAHVFLLNYFALDRICSSSDHVAITISANQEFQKMVTEFLRDNPNVHLISLMDLAKPYIWVFSALILK